MKLAHHAGRMPVPKLDSLGEDKRIVVRIVAARSYLPDPGTVAKFPGAVFPTIRDPRRREEFFQVEGKTVGMYDDNTTPRWALLWAHGIPGKSKQPTKGWTISHVWNRSKDIQAYTHLANLALLPEYFGSLSDKEGPLTHYLRFHAWHVYRWKPADAVAPDKPEGYDDISWRYFTPIDDPVGFSRAEFAKANCGRSKVLKPIMLQSVGGGS